MTFSTDGSARLLLGASVTRDAVDRVAAAHGWSLVNIYRRRDNRPRAVVYATASGDALIAFVDDHRADARYLVVTAHDPEEPLSAARASLPHHTLDDVRAMLAEDRGRGLRWLAVAGPDAATPPWAAIVRASLSDDDERVRDAARFALDELGWPALDWPELGWPELGWPELADG